MSPSIQDKKSAMEELKASAYRTVSNLCEPGRTMVWGKGSLDSPVVIIAEAPGKYEERHVRPFMGQAGKLLDRELAKVGISRENIYITNIVKCRPTRTAGNRMRNRLPTTEEVSAWMPFLIQELEIIRPSIIMCMGATAARWLIKKDFALTKERGEWLEGPLGTAAIVTFHPSYVSRFARDRVLLAFRQDLEKVRARLEQKGEIKSCEL